jgi:hypothetical protein
MVLILELPFYSLELISTMLTMECKEKLAYMDQSELRFLKENPSPFSTIMIEASYSMIGTTEALMNRQ